MRRFVIIGQRATASDDFLLEDVPGTSGRLDVLLRCLRAGLLFSHGMRRDVVMYLVLLGGPRAPRVLRADAVALKFVRPDERSLANLVRTALASRADDGVRAFVEVRPGVSLFSGGLEHVIQDLGGATPYVLVEHAPDIRDVAELGRHNTAFFLGDHLGLDEMALAQLEAIGARSISVGPVSLHAEDVIAIVSNEIDRRHPQAR